MLHDLGGRDHSPIVSFHLNYFTNTPYSLEHVDQASVMTLIKMLHVHSRYFWLSFHLGGF